MDILKTMPAPGSSAFARRLASIKMDKQSAIEKGQTVRDETVNCVLPVIMGNFTDVPHYHSVSEFQTHLFGANPTGSVVDYYDEVSYGQFQISGDVYGTYTAANTIDYYSQDYYGLTGNFPENVGGFICSVLDGADAEIDFSQYDNDGPDGIPNSGDDDGYVDIIVIIHAYAEIEKFKMIAHFADMTWATTEPYVTDDIGISGMAIKIDDYIIQGADIDYNLHNILPIGILCHELGHFLGLTDLYDYNFDSYGIGMWDLMSYGLYGAGNSPETANRPLHFCAWSKVQLGWIVPIVVSGTQQVQFPPVENYPTVYKLWDDAYQGDSYFLLENRCQVGFDSDLPGEGVLIWHCNDEVPFNNNIDEYRIVDLEEADGLDEIDYYLSGMDDGDPFPGSANNTSFTDFTYPNARDRFGNATGVRAEDFAAGPDKVMTATLTQRELAGYTVGAGRVRVNVGAYSGSYPVYLARQFQAESNGFLTEIIIGKVPFFEVPYSFRLFECMENNKPAYQIGNSIDGIFPLSAKYEFDHILVESPVALIFQQPFVVDLKLGPGNPSYPFADKYAISGNSYFSEDGEYYDQWLDKDVSVKVRIKYCVDTDGDGLSDPGSSSEHCVIDNCPDDYNPLQEDQDYDGIGDICDFICGDFDNNENVNILDIVFLINYLYKNGAATNPLERMDINANADVNILDVVYLINFIYKSGPAPVCT